MPERTRIAKRHPRARPIEAAPEAEGSAQIDVAALDALLEDIDRVLEENVLQALSYTQKGGE